MAEPTKVTVSEVKQRLDRGEGLTFIDARNPQAWAAAKTMLPGALRIPADRVEEHVSEIPRDRKVIAYCT